MGTLSATEAHTHVYVNSVVARGSLRESEMTAGSDTRRATSDDWESASRPNR